MPPSIHALRYARHLHLTGGVVAVFWGTLSSSPDSILMLCCRILIASIMEEYNKDAWEELIERCEETGVDAFEINFSCPHGMPERKMGMAMGQDCDLLEVGAHAAQSSS